MQGIYHFIREFLMARKQNRNLFYCEMDQYKVNDVQAVLSVYTELLLSQKYIRPKFSFLLHTLKDD